jgi:hypothetical protein
MLATADKGDPMRRRDFLKALGTALTLVPPFARAQQSIKKKRIALISPARPVEGLKTQPYFRALLDELSRQGFADGENLIVDLYFRPGSDRPLSRTCAVCRGY